MANVITLIRILSIIIALQKYNKFAILHTYTNKLTGLLLFFIPYYLKSVYKTYKFSQNIVSDNLYV